MKWKGDASPLVFWLEATFNNMIQKEFIEAIVQEYLEGTYLTLVKVKVSKDNDIDVEITREDAGVTIDDCADLSRYIETRLDRDKEDFSLIVGSARRKKIGKDEDDE